MPEPDFLKRFANYIQLSRKEYLATQYNTTIEPFLRDVADELAVKYAPKSMSWAMRTCCVACSEKRQKK